MMKKIKLIKPIHGKIRHGDIPHSIASIKKAKLLLKYNPTHNLKDGLKKSISWYYDNLKFMSKIKGIILAGGYGSRLYHLLEVFQSNFYLFMTNQ